MRFVTFLVCNLLLLIWASSSLQPACGQTVQPSLGDRTKALPLVKGKPLKKDFALGDVHSYQISLKAGEYVGIVVRTSSGFDPLVKLAGPDKRQLFSIVPAARDSAMNGRVSVAEALKAETVEYVAERNGIYSLEVRRNYVIEPSSYEIEITELHLATERDRSRATAAKAFSNAEHLRTRDYDPASLQQALREYDYALSIWRALGDEKEEANTLNSMGSTNFLLQAKQTASGYIMLALERWRAAGDVRGEAIALNNLSHLQDDELKSIDYLEQSLRLWRSVGDRRWEAITLYLIGSVYKVRRKSAKAIELYEQSLQVWQTVADRASEAFVLFYLAETYGSLGDKQKCREFYQRAQQNAQRRNFREIMVSPLLRIGETYFVEGEFDQALGYYEQALDLSRHTGTPEEAYSLYSLGTVYFAFNDKDKALDCFRQSLPLWGYNLNGEAYSLEYIGRINSSLDQREKAREYFKQALPLMQLSDRSGEAHIWNDLGLIYAADGDQAQALDSFSRALKLSQNSYKDVEAHTLLNIGGIYDQAGDWQQAYAQYNQALGTFIGLGHKGAEAKARYFIARLLWKNKNQIEAREQIEQALKIVESLRARIVSDELRYAYFTSVRDYYDLYLELLMSVHSQDPTAGFDRAALEVSERGRARSLLEMLTEARVDIRQGVDPALLARERLLRQQLNDKAQRRVSLLRDKHTEEQAATAANQVTDLLTQYRQAQSQIRINNPRYAALTQPQPLSLKQIQQDVLDPDTVLLEYALGEERSYLWAVSHDSLVSYSLPPREQIDQAARRFYDLLKTENREAANEDSRDEQLQRAAQVLSNLILAPVAGKLKAKRLLIVADGALQYIPFAALADPSGDNPTMTGVQAVGYHPLIERYEIVHLPSASTLAVIREELKGRPAAALSVAVVADPVFSATDERVRRAPLRHPITSGAVRAGSNEQQSTTLNTSSNSTLLTRAVRDAGIGGSAENIPRLPYTRREAMQILALVGPREGLQAVDFEASRQLVTSGRMAQYRIVHLATHGVLDVKDPELSGLIFSLVDHRGQPEDGFLRLPDIFNLSLNADLVVLSACQTGLGKDVRGEGLVGLTRGFMYSGAARVMTSLWKVDDTATAELMKYFYEAMLKDKQTPASALRTAQLKLWQTRRWHSPSNWSAFILQGEFR